MVKLILKNSFLFLLLISFFLGSCSQDITDSQNKVIGNLTLDVNNQIQKTSALTTYGHATGAIMGVSNGYTSVQPFNFSTVSSYLSINNMIPAFLVQTSASIVLNHPSIGNQGSVGSCVSWATGYAAKEILDITFGNILADNGLRSGPFLYYLIHYYNNDPNDDGLSPLAGISYAQNYGVASVNTFPNSTSSLPFNVMPSSAAISSASTDKAYSYASITSLSSIKQALQLGLPVTFAFNFYNDFENAFLSQTTWATLNTPVGGGHDVCVIGYDDSKQALLLQNSWGTSGGDSTYPGCVWVTYNVVNTLINNGQLEMYTLWNTPGTVLALPYIAAASTTSPQYWEIAYGTPNVNKTIQSSIFANLGKTINVHVEAWGGKATFSVIWNSSILTGAVNNSISVTNGSKDVYFVMPSNIINIPITFNYTDLTHGYGAITVSYK
jgi:hypothetical protein